MGDAAWIVGKGNDEHNDPVSLHKSDGVNALVIAEIVHAVTHQGKLFTISGIREGIVNNASFYLGVTVPAGKELHLVVEGSASGDAHGHIYENATFNGGTATTPVNRNRVSSNTLTGFTFAIDPTITVPGDLIYTSFLAGGTGNQAGGSTGESFGEWVLAPGSYIFEMENKAGNNVTMAAQMTFYEESD